MMKPRPILERFEEKYVAEPNSGCWLWIAGCSRGYGTFGISRGNMCKAHRMSWVLYRGPIPKGLLVLHKCDVPICVNPDHLYLGTHKDNTRDAIVRHRHTTITNREELGRIGVEALKKFSVKRGIPIRAKLTREQAIEARDSRDPVIDIAGRFGICIHTIYRIKNGKSYTWAK